MGMTGLGMVAACSLSLKLAVLHCPQETAVK